MRQSQPRLAAHHAALRLGGLCIIVGSLAVFAFRLAHGDPPAADPEADLRFIAGHSAYAGVHLGAIVGVVTWVCGFTALSDTLGHPFAKLLGRLGTACILVGAAVYIVDFTIDGVAGQDLARAWVAAPPAAQADLVLVAKAATTILRGTSLVAIIVLWGVPLLLFGRALMLETYPSWLGWSGLAVGAATILGSAALLFLPDLFPGVLVYGLLASVAVQLWSLALGALMLRRAGLVTAGPTA